MTPLKRFYNLLRLDKTDVYQLIFYAIFAGFISLSLPLGIQAIINFIQSGRVSVSWIVLVVLVVIGVAFGGLLSFMQLRITENLQQKIFIRSSFEFACRLPKIKFEDIYNYYPPELANRFFDTLTIQKGTSKLLVDFSAALLQIIFGVILLSAYHPFFIAFGFLLILLLYLIFKFSYNSGLETSLKESKYKYKVVEWLQEIARNHFSFRKKKHFDFALVKNDELVKNYLKYREKHFNVIRKQFIQLIGFKMLITASLLSVGGYLVLSQQLNIGQFVASEIIILMVINSVEKIVVGLETFYDVLTSIEKIGQITDMELEDESQNEKNTTYKKIELHAENVSFQFPDANYFAIDNLDLTIKQGEKIYLDGNNGAGKTTLIRLLASFLHPTKGNFFINEDTFLKIDYSQFRSHIGYVAHGESPFEGTLLQNLTFSDETIPHETVKWALESIKLTSFVKSLTKGLETKIIPEGKQLSSSDAQKIVLARTVINKPKILFLEDSTNKMDDEVAKEIIDFIMDNSHEWTVVVTSKNPYWKQKSTRVITLNQGKIIADINQ
jgi:ABC-type bacteriocin/lantibiotic exporter with double-glycine peptidase domain